MPQRLHFVYNVEAHPVDLVKDFVHRIVDHESYSCRLCDLTYGRFVKKPGWQLFLWSLPVKSSFYTKDVFSGNIRARRTTTCQPFLRKTNAGHSPYSCRRRISRSFRILKR